MFKSWVVGFYFFISPLWGDPENSGEGGLPGSD
jgi:hypothetical protein